VGLVYGGSSARPRVGGVLKACRVGWAAWFYLVGDTVGRGAAGVDAGAIAVGLLTVVAGVALYALRSLGLRGLPFKASVVMTAGILVVVAGLAVPPSAYYVTVWNTTENGSQVPVHIYVPQRQAMILAAIIGGVALMLLGFLLYMLHLMRSLTRSLRGWR
jgi:hypothetical protein